MLRNNRAILTAVLVFIFLAAGISGCSSSLPRDMSAPSADPLNTDRVATVRPDYVIVT